jgi:hypothetical protein
MEVCCDEEDEDIDLMGIPLFSTRHWWEDDSSDDKSYSQDDPPPFNALARGS